MVIIYRLYFYFFYNVFYSSVNQNFRSFRIIGEFLWEKMKKNYAEKSEEAFSTSTSTSTTRFEDFITSDNELEIKLKLELEKRIEKIKIEEEIKLIENQSYQDSIDPLGKR